MIARLRASRGDQRGQTLVLFVVFMFGLVLLLALVIDVGAWKRAQRQAQIVADAAALAGAHELVRFSSNTAGAANAALLYRDLNAPGVAIASDPRSDGSMTVTASQDVPALFAKVAGFLNITVRARATAQVVPPVKLRNSDLTRFSKDTKNGYIAPIVVNVNKVCRDPSCFDREMTLTLNSDEDDSEEHGDNSDLGNSDFGMICRGSCDDSSQLASNVRCCIGGDFASSTTVSPAEPSATNSCEVRGALLDVRGTTLVVPVFDKLTSDGYHIVGFAAFVITDVNPSNVNPCKTKQKLKWLKGHFTKYTTADNVPDALGNTASAPDYGVEVIGLTS